MLKATFFGFWVMLKLLISDLFNPKQKFFKKVNVKLDTALREREVDKIILKGKILKMLRKYLRVDAKSEYIPKDRRNYTEIRERILAEFGSEMAKVNLAINDNLELK